MHTRREVRAGHPVRQRLLAAALGAAALGAAATACGTITDPGAGDATGQAPAGSPAAPAGAELTDARFAQLTRGVNVSHWFSQAPVTPQWTDGYITGQELSSLRALGFRHVRVPVDPDLLYDAANPAVLDPANLAALDRALDKIAAAGLAVIVDLHPWNTDFKRRLAYDDAHVARVVRFWGALAAHLGRRDPERVFLEVMNESQVFDAARWATMQRQMLAAMRAGAPRHTLIAEGPGWTSIDELAMLPVTADRNVVYNFHFYEPMEFTHQGADWSTPELAFLKNLPYPSSPGAIAAALPAITDPAARAAASRYGQAQWNAAIVRSRIGQAADWARRNGVRVTCNEFGVYRLVAPAVDRNRWIGDVRAALEGSGIGWSMWDWAGGFSLVTWESGPAHTPDPATLAALGLR